MTEQTKWVVTLSGERGLAEVRRALGEAGFEAEQVLPEIGILTGRCPAGAVAGLRGIPGVADVSPEHGIDIGPSDPGRPW